MIVLAALFIVIESIDRWRAGSFPQNLGTGTAIVAAASAANLALGLYLVRTGRRTRSLILEANGKHVLADSWTSLGVVVGLLLVLWTGWAPFDPILAIGVALNILVSGGALLWRSVKGLMDYADPETGNEIRRHLERICAERGVRYHELRYRSTGNRTLIEVHLLFPYRVPVGEAHRIATQVERELISALPFTAEAVTHLESIEDHDLVH